MKTYDSLLNVSLTARAATLFGDALAVITEETRLSFVDLHRRVEHIATRLGTKGVGTGDRIGIACHDAESAMLSMFGIFDSGATAVPLPLRYPASSLARMCNSAGVSYVITDDEAAPVTASSTAEAGTLMFSELMTGGNDGSNPVRQIGRDPDRIVLGVFTSGSAGDPKAAALRYSNLIFSALGANRNMPMTAADRWLLCLPLYHVGGIGILIRCLLAGAAVAVAKSGVDISDSLESFAATHVSVVPTQLQRLVDAGTASQTMEAVLVGGGATRPDLATAAVRKGIPLRLTYGLTEMASQVATTNQSQEAGSCGHVLPFRSVKIGEDDEIMVRGETLFAGYLDSGVVRAATDSEGWFHTGDRGFFDERCNLVVTGRIDDMFVSGGENIYPEEIEFALSNILGIDRCVVVGVMDNEFGSRPVAFVTFSHEPIPEMQILEHLRKLLPGYKVPISVLDLPESAERDLSKVNRRQLSGIAYKLMQEKGLIEG